MKNEINKIEYIYNNDYNGIIYNGKTYLFTQDAYIVDSGKYDEDNGWVKFRSHAEADDGSSAEVEWCFDLSYYSLDDVDDDIFRFDDVANIVNIEE